MNREDITVFVAFLPVIVSLRGRGGVWKFLSLLFCGMTAWSGLTGGLTVVAITLWVIAWIFAGIALQGRRREVEEPIISREVSGPGPGLFEPDGVHAGIPYRLLRDGSVEAIMQGATVGFADYAKFSTATGAPPLKDIPPPQLPPDRDILPPELAAERPTPLSERLLPLHAACGVLARLASTQLARAIVIAAALVTPLMTLSIITWEDGFLGFGFILAFVSLLVGLGLLISKKRRALGKTLALAGPVAAVIGFGVMADRFAQKKGFLNSADRSAAPARGNKASTN